MRISYNDANVLEGIVRSVFSCSRFGMGGIIDANHFKDEPFDAALIVLAPLWQKAAPNEIEHFMLKWELPLRKDSGKEVDIQAYIDELKDLTSRLLPPAEVYNTKSEIPN